MDDEEVSAGVTSMAVALDWAVTGGVIRGLGSYGHGTTGGIVGNVDAACRIDQRWAAAAVGACTSRTVLLSKTKRKFRGERG